MPSVYKALLPATAALLLAGCAQVGVPMPPSLDLPKPVTDLRAFRKGNKVILTWTQPTRTTDGQKIKTLGKTSICRGLQAPLTGCNAVGQATAQPVNNRPETVKYVDVLSPSQLSDNKNAFATYAVEVMNDSGRGAGFSNQVQVPLVSLTPPPDDFHVTVTAGGVLVSWTCPFLSQSAPEYRLRIYRRTQSGEPLQIADLGIEACPSSFLDQSIDWGETYYYRATIVAFTTQPATEVEGDDTQDVKVEARDVFPPRVPSGLQAVFSGVGQKPYIDLSWAPGTDADLAGYNIYRHEEGGEAVKLNPELVKAPAYRDETVQGGKKYFYAVTAVDLRNNESARSDEASEQVPQETQ